MAHRPRAPARVDRRRTFGKSDFVQMTFSGTSKKTSNFCPKTCCFYPVWVLRVACFLCVSVCVLRVRAFVRGCVLRVRLRVTLKTSPCVPAPSPHVVTTCGRGASTHRDVLNVHTAVYQRATPRTHGSPYNPHTKHTQQHTTTEHSTTNRTERQQTHKERQRLTNETTQQRNRKHATRVTQDETRRDETGQVHIFTFR